MSFVSQAISVLVGCLAVVAFMAMQMAATYWILRPLYQAASKQKVRWQFTVGDFLILCLMIQVPVGVAYAFIPAEDHPRNQLGGLFVLSAIVSGYVWWMGVDLLAKVGVHSWPQRLICLMFVAPLASLGVPVLEG